MNVRDTGKPKVRILPRCWKKFQKASASIRKPVGTKKRGSAVGAVVCAAVGVVITKADSTTTAAAIRASCIVLLACGCAARRTSDLWPSPAPPNGLLAHFGLGA